MVSDMTDRNRNGIDSSIGGSNGRYILDANGNPIAAPDVPTWAKWFETAQRQVALTKVEPGVVEVSTVFLGLDHGFGSGPPVLWETMIFGGSHDGYRNRYGSRAAAVEGHKLAVEIAEGKRQPEDGDESDGTTVEDA